LAQRQASEPPCSTRTLGASELAHKGTLRRTDAEHTRRPGRDPISRSTGRSKLLQTPLKTRFPQHGDGQALRCTAEGVAVRRTRGPLDCRTEPGKGKEQGTVPKKGPAASCPSELRLRHSRARGLRAAEPGLRTWRICAQVGHRKEVMRQAPRSQSGSTAPRHKVVKRGTQPGERRRSRPTWQGPEERSGSKLPGRGSAPPLSGTRPFKLRCPAKHVRAVPASEVRCRRPAEGQALLPESASATVRHEAFRLRAPSQANAGVPASQIGH
jgi:hypothetical protein